MSYIPPLPKITKIRNALSRQKEFKKFFYRKYCVPREDISYMVREEYLKVKNKKVELKTTNNSSKPRWRITIYNNSDKFNTIKTIEFDEIFNTIKTIEFDEIFNLDYFSDDLKSLLLFHLNLFI